MVTIYVPSMKSNLIADSFEFFTKIIPFPIITIKYHLFQAVVNILAILKSLLSYLSFLLIGDYTYKDIKDIVVLLQRATKLPEEFPPQPSPPVQLPRVQIPYSDTK